jgi:hypothetical protein
MKAIGRRSLSSLLGLLAHVGVYVAGLGLLLAACLLCLSLGADVQNIELGLPVSIRLAAASVEVDGPSPGTAGELSDVHGVGTLRFKPENRALAVATSIAIAGVFGLALWVMLELRAVLRTLDAGQPFVAANAIRIRHIAYAILLGEAGRLLLAVAGRAWLKTHLVAPDWKFDAWPSINVIALAASALIFVIAEVFREGARIEEEQALTV